MASTWNINLMNEISIHAPRTGSDLRLHNVDFSGFIISIHAPRTGSDHAPSPDPNNYKQFQSTLPARGATMQVQMLVLVL